MRPLLLLLALVAFAHPAEPTASPAATAAQWLEMPDAAAQAAKGRAAETDKIAPPSFDGTTLGIIAGGALTALVVGLKIARNVPGVAGTIAGVLEMGVQHFAPDRYQRAKEDGQVAAKGFKSIVSIIESCDNSGTIADLKKKIANKAPSDVKDAINTYVNESV